MLRFARPPTPSPAAVPHGGPVVVADVHLDDQPVAAGQIVYQFDAWHYVPAAEPAVNLVSTLSRQDIEAQIARHYLGETHGLELKSPGLPLAM